MKPERSSSIRLSQRDIPFLVSLGVVGIGLLLAGADLPLASLTLSFSYFLLLLIAIFVIDRFSVPNWHLLLWGLPVGLLGVHAAMNRIGDGHAEYLALFACLLAYSTGVHAGARSTSYEIATRCVIGLGFIYAFISFVLFFGNLDGGGFSVRQGQNSRLAGTLGSANSAATFFGVILLVALNHWRSYLARSGTTQNSGISRIVTTLVAAPVTSSAILLLSTCLLLTASRAGLAAFVLAVSIWIVARVMRASSRSKTLPSARQHLSLIVPVLVILVLVLVWSMSGDLVQDRLLSTDGSDASRRMFFDVALQSGQRAPVFGHGLGSLNEVKWFEVTPENRSTLYHANAVHNLYAQWFVQAGLIGLLGLSALWAGYANAALRTIRRSRRAGLGLAILVLVATHGIFDYGLEIPAIAIFIALVLGLNSSVERR